MYLGKRYDVTALKILVLKSQIHIKHFANIPQFETGGTKNTLNGIMTRRGHLVPPRRYFMYLIDLFLSWYHSKTLGYNKIYQ